MAQFKLNIGDPKTKKTLKKEVDQAQAKNFVGKKIGDTIKGELLDLPGYEMQITGGSDNAGFPMRKDVFGIQRKKVLIVSGIGIRKNVKGRKVRRMVAGNTIHEGTAQINLKITKSGKTPLFEEPKQEEAPKEESPKQEEKKE